jgi:predicted  nucleic acid-binding Zn-ribbon protein
MSAALGLMRLQRVDSELDRVNAELARIEATLADNSAVAKAQRDAEAANALKEDTEHQRQNLETEAKSQRQKIRDAESRLYGGKVRNPKELQDLEADVASLGKHLASLEERELSWMERLEGAEERLAKAQRRLEQIEAEATGVEQRLGAERETVLRTKVDLQTERAATVGTLDSNLLEKYEALRNSKRGVAVAQIKDNSCGACGTALTAALQQDARHMSQLVKCPSCGRILYGG